MACWAAWLHTNQMAPPCISSSRRSVKRHTMPRRTTQCVLKCCVLHQRHLGEEEEQPLLGGGCDRHTRVGACEPTPLVPLFNEKHINWRFHVKSGNCVLHCQLSLQEKSLSSSQSSLPPSISEHQQLGALLRHIPSARGLWQFYGLAKPL